MRNAKLWLCMAFMVGALSGTAGMMVRGPAVAAAPEKGLKEHWRYHDNHWSYYDDSDQRWYYTDGANWYYNEGAAWKVYAFDKKFGREKFERGEYKVPGEGAKVIVPRHGVWKPQ